MNGSPVSPPSPSSIRAAADLALSVALGQPPPAPPPPRSPEAATATAVGSTQTRNAPSPVIEPPSPFAWEPPPGFDPVPQDFYLYHPDHGQGRAIFGLLLDALPMAYARSPDGHAIAAIHGLVIQLIEPTIVLDPSASRRTLVAAPGQDIMLIADTPTLRRLVRAAVDPQSVSEVWLRPDFDTVLAYGPDRWVHWIARSGKQFARSQIKRGAR